jgi:hypothetical protein
MPSKIVWCNFQAGGGCLIKGVRLCDLHAGRRRPGGHVRAACSNPPPQWLGHSGGIIMRSIDYLGTFCNNIDLHIAESLLSIYD